MNKLIRRFICVGLILIISISIPAISASAASDSQTLKRGMSGSSITKLQNDLKKLGFLTAAATGYFGSLTEDAVKKFQKKYTLTVTGKADSKTLSKIALIIKRKLIKIVIDPGHGGIDVGTSKGNILESDINLNISKALKDNLANDAYNVLLTRDKDVSLSNLSNNGDSLEERDLNARTNIINNSSAKIFVSIHLNSDPSSPETSGSIVYYNDKLPKSKELAAKIQQELNNIKFGSLVRQSHGIAEANYYILRNSNIPGVLVETGFITNSKEYSIINSVNYKNQISSAVERGINSFLD